MSCCYTSSNSERVYTALESAYGVVPAITAANRIPIVKLTAKQVPEQTSRRDKTGSRTFPGLPNTIRKTTSFGLNTFMTEWTNQTVQPTHGPLFQAAMGAAPVFYEGGTVASVTGGTEIAFTAAHGLSAGQGVAFGGEMRFVAAIQDTLTIFLNAPFNKPPIAGSTFGITITFGLAETLGSVSIFDYWDPIDGGAANSGRRGDEHDDCEGQRGFSGIRFCGAGLGI